MLKGRMRVEREVKMKKIESEAISKSFSTLENTFYVHVSHNIKHLRQSRTTSIGIILKES